MFVPAAYPLYADLLMSSSMTNIFGSFLYRKQLSAKDQLWCLSGCKKDTVDSKNNMCTTLYGQDLCSPGEGKAVSGKTCVSSCKLNDEKEYYYCYTDEDMEEWEYCGFYNVPEEKKKILEFTVDDAVCADYCGKEKRGGDKDTCTFVEWEVFQGKVSNEWKMRNISWKFN